MWVKKISKKIPIAFHNRSNSNQKKELENKKRFSRRTWKTIYLFRRKYWKIHNLYSSNKKEVAESDTNGEEVTKNISHIIQFIDSARFMASSLANLVNNLSEGIHKIKCRYRQVSIKYEVFRITYDACNCFLEYTNFKGYLMKYKCLSSN